MSLDLLVRSLEQLRVESDRTERHELKVCDAPIILFKATKSNESENTEEFDWRSFTTGQCITVPIDSYHREMTSPYASQAIAAQLVYYMQSDKEHINAPA
jgi:thioesterase domain-containing protein